MRIIIFNIIVLLISFGSCTEKQATDYKKVLYLGDSVRLFGYPDSTVLSKFISNEVDNNYLINNLTTLSVILEPPSIYHCFITEQVGTDKQIYYLKMDDATNYNWIPSYDSLKYDLSLDFINTEMAGCTVNNFSAGEPYYLKPDVPLKWSSTYEKLPYIRRNSEEYNSIILQCNDIDELSDYLNHSLFFQNHDFVNDYDKEWLLTILISITQIQYVDCFFDFERYDFDIFDYILFEYHYNGRSDMRTIKVTDFKEFKYVMMKYKREQDSLYEEIYTKEHLRKDIRRSVSRYLLDMNKANLDNILNNIEGIERLYNQSSMMFFHHRPHHDIRIFFFNITYDENNKITIEKNYYNKEYITTTRIRGYL